MTINELLSTLSKKINSVFTIKHETITDDQLISFEASFSSKDWYSNIYLSVNQNKTLLFYKITNNNNDLDQELLFDFNGNILFHNSHCNMANDHIIKMEDGTTKIEDLNFWQHNIICNFEKVKQNITSSIDNICYHYEKSTEKRPIPTKHCHIISKADLHKISQKESRIRKKFNEQESECAYCKRVEKLIRSHLVSSHNIKKLGLCFYSSRFFDDLKNKPINSLMTISEYNVNSQNNNFKISCFCETCEQIFTKTDNNTFYDIKEIEHEILIKSFGIYFKETLFNNEIYQFIEQDLNKNNSHSFLLQKLQKERDLLHINNFNINKSITKFSNTSYKIQLKEQPFLESCSLSFNNNLFYLIYITNKNDIMFVNVITNDLNYKNREQSSYWGIIYAAITLNRYTFYSENIHSKIKNIAYNMIYDYYNNDCLKNASHPLLIPKINYIEDIKKILTDFVK